MKYILQKQCRDHEFLRESFDHLAKDTFDISFAAWHQAGYWTQRYCPYSLIDHGAVIANASVNLMHLTWQERTYRYIQIGTVMTHPAYQGQGCASSLLASIQRDWNAKCDGMYLYANPAAASFYEAHGFRRVQEYVQHCAIQPCPKDFQRLNVRKPEHLALLKRCYEDGNPYAALTATDNFPLLMFYCSEAYRDDIYYSKEHDTVCILQQEAQQLICLDFFGKARVKLLDLLNELPTASTRVTLGFTPKDTDTMKEEESNALLFVWSEQETIFSQAHLQMPLLTHA